MEKQDIEDRPKDMGAGEEGECGTYGDTKMETYMAMCKTDSQREFAVMVQGTQTGALQQSRGWDGEGDGGRFMREGTWVYLWLILVDVWQKTTKLCTAIILQLIKNKMNQKTSCVLSCSAVFESLQPHGL